VSCSHDPDVPTHDPDVPAVTAVLVSCSHDPDVPTHDPDVRSVTAVLVSCSHDPDVLTHGPDVPAATAVMLLSTVVVAVWSQSDVILLMTCSVREGAEQKIWNRLEFLKSLKLTRQRLRSSGLPPVKIGILGEST